MSRSKSVVWSEGMFISPQHFQQFDRALRAYADGLATLDVEGGDHGFSRLSLNGERLKVGKVSVQQASGVLPDRTYFDLSEEQTLDIPEGTVGKTVFLAVPLARLGTTQVGDQRGVHRQLSERVEIHDISNHQNEPVDAEISSLGVCLRLEGDDMSGFSAMPVTRVLERLAEGPVILDKGFVPPCLAICASEVLMDRVSDMVSLARARAANTGARIAAMRQSQRPGSYLDERLELGALNRGVFAVQNALAHPHISARRLYRMLGDMIVSLEAGDATPVDAALLYEAQNPGGSFDQLFMRLRRKLTLRTEASVMELQWNTELFEKRRLLRMVVAPSILAEGRRPVLAVSAPVGHEGLIDIVPSVCKLAGISAMPELVKMGLPAIKLTSLGTAPSELRDKADAAFFAIDTGSPHWQRFVEKKEALAMHVDDRIPSLTSTLYLLG
jgi:type VI secretion system protein ImpJ